MHNYGLCYLIDYVELLNYFINGSDYYGLRI